MEEAINSYSEMLDIPVNSYNITVKEDKKKSAQRKKLTHLEDVKKKLLDKINAKSQPDKQPIKQQAEENSDGIETVEKKEIPAEAAVAPVTDEVKITSKKSTTVSRYFAKLRKKVNIKIPKVNVISVQIAVIVGLALLITLTSVFNHNSGIAVFMRSVFGTEKPESVLSEQNYDKYTVNVAYTDYTYSNGVITVSETGSVYSPLDGIVSSVTRELDKFTVEIAHSENFATKISGLTFAFCSQGDKIYKNVPMGYMDADNYSVCFYSGSDMIENYSINGNTVVWQN